jgi:bifunctional DNA-binding transcriptional regulator/antitoxin component of YhaV-PrlF toxin-antitoxin module
MGGEGRSDKWIELRKIDTVKVSIRGDSLQVTIPRAIREIFDIKKGDRLSFFIHPTNKNYIFLMKEQEIRTELPPLPGTEKTHGVFTVPFTIEEFKGKLKEAKRKRQKKENINIKPDKL